MPESAQASAGHKKRLREYETVFAVKPDLADEVVDKVKERVRGVVNREGGKVLKITNWGKKKTAFVVAKQPRAVYLHMSYLAGPTVVAEVERNLRNMEEVSKFISARVADEVDPDTRNVEPDVKLAGDVEEARPKPDREGEMGDDDMMVEDEPKI